MREALCTRRDSTNACLHHTGGEEKAQAARGGGAGRGGEKATFQRAMIPGLTVLRFK